MNLFDFVRADGGGSLMPILIFIIWIAVSLIGNSKAKKKRRMIEEQRRRQYEAERETEAEPQHRYNEKLEETLSQPKTETKQKESVFDDLARELDIIVDDEPERAEVPVSNEKEKLPLYGEFSTYENYEVPPAVVGSSADVSEAGPLLEEGSVASSASAITDAPGSLQMVPRFSVSTENLDDARRGMVWTEILAPPKALREETQSLTFFS